MITAGQDPPPPPPLHYTTCADKSAASRSHSCFFALILFRSSNVNVYPSSDFPARMRSKRSARSVNVRISLNTPFVSSTGNNISRIFSRSSLISSSFISGGGGSESCFGGVASGLVNPTAAKFASNDAKLPETELWSSTPGMGAASPVVMFKLTKSALSALFPPLLLLLLLLWSSWSWKCNISFSKKFRKAWWYWSNLPWSAKAVLRSDLGQGRENTM